MLPFFFDKGLAFYGTGLAPRLGHEDWGPIIAKERIEALTPKSAATPASESLAYKAHAV